MMFLQTCNKTRSDCLPVVDSPLCWGCVLQLGMSFRPFYTEAVSLEEN